MGSPLSLVVDLLLNSLITLAILVLLLTSSRLFVRLINLGYFREVIPRSRKPLWISSRFVSLNQGRNREPLSAGNRQGSGTP